jgi:hypothetical protein
MSTHRRTWQRKEQRAAALFGSLRKVLSGSSGRDDETRSDSVHPRLFIESKLRPKTAARSLWEATRILARREGKVPVVMLFDKGKPGGLVIVHQDDLQAVAAELARQDRAEAAGGPVEPGGLPADPEPFHPGDRP